jgi:hypothetical protein
MRTTPTHSSDQALPLLILWEKSCHIILNITQEIPKSARFTFVSRIEGCALDLYVQLIQARYAHSNERSLALREADRLLATLRALIRLAHGRTLISHSALERVTEVLSESGQMLGGWRKSVERRGR